MAEKALSGQIAVITGASRGIGAATAVTLSQHGLSRLFLHYNSNSQGAEQVAAAVRANGCQVDLFQADLGTDAGIDALCGYLKTNAPAVDILVNNAGSLVQ